MVAAFLSFRNFVFFSSMTTTVLPVLSLIVTVSLPTAVTVPSNGSPWAASNRVNNRIIKVQEASLLNMDTPLFGAVIDRAYSLMVMFVTILCGRCVFALQKFSNFFFSSQLGGTLRIHPFHLLDFFGRHARQVTNEVNKIPALQVVVIPWLFTTCRHSGESDSVLNNVVDFSVCQVLC